MADEPPRGIAPPHHRLPLATHIGRVVLRVASVERSIAFYNRVLGLTVLSRRAGTVEMGVRHDGTVLIELHEMPGAAPVPAAGQLGLFHFAVLLPTRSALGSFLSHLATVGVRAGAADHLVSEALYLTDPDGLGIEVYADRDRSTWQFSSGQVVMASEPLDTESLVQLAEAPWDGAPAGTLLGHVHLRVADLDAATTFYHDALGFDKMAWNYPGALFLAAGGYHHHVGINVWSPRADPPTPGAASMLSWELVVPSEADVRSVASQVERTGRSVTRPGDGVSAADPWGTTVRIRAER